jgi:serine/threonine protein kinase
MSGRLVAEKYRLDRLLGEGAAGAVWEAENVLVGRKVAIKLLHAELAEDPVIRARFLAEARAAARIAHPNVVDVFDIGNDEGRPFMVMELCLGETLEHVLDSRGAVGATYACELMLQVLSALAAAHEIGIVHRDLKPGNIMVVHPRPDRPSVKVLDFGIAKGVFAEDVVPDETGLLFGTPEYIAPEAATGGTVDARSDLYAAGCILYELLAGRPPFVGNSPTVVLAAMLTTAPPPLRSLAPQVPAALEQVVHATLAKEPEGRPQSAREFIALLAPFTDARKLPSMLPPSVSEEPIPLTKRGASGAYPVAPDAAPPAASPPRPPPAPKKKAKLVLVAEPSIPPPPPKDGESK